MYERCRTRNRIRVKTWRKGSQSGSGTPGVTREKVREPQSERFEDGLATVHDDLPREVVGDDLTRRLCVERTTSLPTKIDGELLKYLRAKLVDIPRSLLAA